VLAVLRGERIESVCRGAPLEADATGKDLIVLLQTRAKCGIVDPRTRAAAIVTNQCPFRSSDKLRGAGLGRGGLVMCGSPPDRGSSSAKAEEPEQMLRRDRRKPHHEQKPTAEDDKHELFLRSRHSIEGSSLAVLPLAVPWGAHCDSSICNRCPASSLARLADR